MLYGPFQYYNDELISWTSIVEFHKEQSGKLVRQVTVVLDQPGISSTFLEKEQSTFIDQFMAQEREFDHIINLITS